MKDNYIPPMLVIYEYDTETAAAGASAGENDNAYNDAGGFE